MEWGAAEVTTPAVQLRVLFLCTGNSARSQIAEALAHHLGRGRVTAASAGTRPAERVNPFALEALREAGIAWRGHPPQDVSVVEGRDWDVVITVCDNAKEACPVLPGARKMLHWGLPDPAEVEGSDAVKRAAFRDTLEVLRGRIARLLEGS